MSRCLPASLTRPRAPRRQPRPRPADNPHLARGRPRQAGRAEHTCQLAARCGQPAPFLHAGAGRAAAPAGSARPPGAGAGRGARGVAPRLRVARVPLVGQAQLAAGGRAVGRQLLDVERVLAVRQRRVRRECDAAQVHVALVCAPRPAPGPRQRRSAVRRLGNPVIRLGRHRMPRRAAPRVDTRADAAPAPPCARSVSRTSAAPVLGGKPLLSDCCRSRLAKVACSCTARGGTGQARSEPGDGPLEKVGERCPSGAGGAPRLTYITLVGCSGEGMMRALSAGCGAACAGAGAGAGGTCAAACGKTGRAHSLCWCRSAIRLATATGGGAAVRSVTGGAPCIARSGPRRPAATACTSWLPCPAAIAAPLPASPRPARNASPARAAQGPALQLLMPKPVVLVNLPGGRSQSRGSCCGLSTVAAPGPALYISEKKVDPG